MPNVIITEYIGSFRSGQTQAAFGPLASQTVAIGASNAVCTNAAHAGTGLLRIFAEADCNVTIAADPNAGTGIVIPLTAGQYDYFTVEPGTGMKVAVISRTVA